MQPFLTVNKFNKTASEIAQLREEHNCLCVLVDELGMAVLISTNAPAYPGGRRYALAGGKMEPGEDPETTCRREVREEAGFVLEAVTSLGEALVIKKDRRSVSYGFVAHIRLSDQLPLELTQEEKDEDHQTHVMPYDEAVALLSRQYADHHREPATGVNLRNLVILLEAKGALN